MNKTPEHDANAQIWHALVWDLPLGRARPYSMLRRNFDKGGGGSAPRANDSRLWIR